MCEGLMESAPHQPESATRNIKTGTQQQTSRFISAESQIRPEEFPSARAHYLRDLLRRNEAGSKLR